MCVLGYKEGYMRTDGKASRQDRWTERGTETDGSKEEEEREIA